MYHTIWHQEDIPQEIKDISIVHLYKWKGNRQACDNHRGISIAEKVLARILLNHLNQHLKQDFLPESRGCGMVDMAITARQLQAKCQEQNEQPLYYHCGPDQGL